MPPALAARRASGVHSHGAPWNSRISAPSFEKLPPGTRLLSATNLMYRDMKAVVEGHRPILRALRRRDPQRASRVMTEHLGEVLELFLTKVIRKDRPKDRSRSETLRRATQAQRLASERLG